MSAPNKKLREGSDSGAIDDLVFPSGVDNRVVERINLDEKVMEFFLV